MGLVKAVVAHAVGQQENEGAFLKAFQVLSTPSIPDAPMEYLVVLHAGSDLEITLVYHATESPYNFLCRLRLCGYAQLPSYTLTYVAFRNAKQWLKGVTKGLYAIPDVCRAPLRPDEKAHLEQLVHRRYTGGKGEEGT